MNNKHEGMVRGFTQLSTTYYGAACLENADYIDSVTFGFYSNEGGTTGEIEVKWIVLGGKVTPEITVFSDAWSALSNFHDLIDLLAKHDDEDTTPEEFCKYLLECGFTDMAEKKED